MNMIPVELQNRVINDDVMTVLRDLPDNSIDVVYGDPDYNVGMKYAGRSFTSSWDEYIDWYIELAKESLRVLRDDGNMFFINYPKQNAHLRVRYLDDHAFDVNDYVWTYNTNIGISSRRFTLAHRSVLHITKSKYNRFFKSQVAQPYRNLNDKRVKKNIENGSNGRMPYSWFYFDHVKNVGKNKTIHPCQIPEGLSQLLLKSCTQAGDSAFILFGGSGSEVVQAQELGLTYLTCEIESAYCDLINSRIANKGIIEDKYRSQSILRRQENYGKYQRQGIVT